MARTHTRSRRNGLFSPNTKNAEGFSALHLAARHGGSALVIEHLIDAGANVMLQAKGAWYPLNFACDVDPPLKVNVQVVTLFIQSGATVSAKVGGKSLLDLAKAKGDVDAELADLLSGKVVPPPRPKPVVPPPVVAAPVVAPAQVAPAAPAPVPTTEPAPQAPDVAAPAPAPALETTPMEPTPAEPTPEAPVLETPTAEAAAVEAPTAEAAAAEAPTAEAAAVEAPTAEAAAAEAPTAEAAAAEAPTAEAAAVEAPTAETAAVTEQPEPPLDAVAASRV